MLNRKKIMDFDHCEEYLRSGTNKILSWQCSESKFSSSCHLQIDEKINSVKEDPKRKTNSNFNYSQAT